ncbi:MAG: hypothetical protein HN742_21700 [Lentisphaerae bacterium]|jgi:hypothetical protein|nr:hypothetical protein [Lentisphaerota bacterium]MBT5608350.1 hypothetical protein [Lentisphaerota bacterium]MBT7061658.1 hypothetical protein [Lentisphaerota bacterium]MBT7844507.1 hypothetical protein [Lentisphaerota bacterium]
MAINADDKRTLRALARRYSEIAHLDVQKQRLGRYAESNSLEAVRPVVLIAEVPWGEIREDALTNTCAPELGWLETPLRQTLYQWEHFQGDLVVPPVLRVAKRSRWATGIGVGVQDKTIKGDTGAYISSHEYTDQLQTEADLAKLQLPEITYDKEASEQALATASEVFAGLMEIELTGTGSLAYNIWDRISTLRGVDSLLTDLAMRPEFMHQTAQRFMEIGQAQFKQLEEQDLLDPSPTLLHCTPACTRELPAEDFAGHVRAKDVWGRCAAQIFGAVSPEMHDEFDLAYNQTLFADCGLLYYGCCEPMDRKIDILRKRFRNLRKISITPWADPRRAAENIGRDYVLAAKPNPAFVAASEFNPTPVEEEIAGYCEACVENGTTLEFVLKDISTIANNPQNLTQWANTVQRVIDRYYG